MNSYTNMSVAFTGIRDLHPDSILRVRDAVFRVLSQNPSQLRFGGAIGVDTVALLTAIHYPPPNGPRPELVVVVPGFIYEQPPEAYAAIRKAVGIGAVFVELALDLANPQSYWKRNAVLIAPAHAVVGFADGRTSGGTHGTLKMARAAGKLVEEIPVSAA